MQDLFDRALGRAIINLSNLATVQPTQKLNSTGCTIVISEPGALQPLWRAVGGESRKKVVKFIRHEIDVVILAAYGLIESTFMTEAATREGSIATRARYGKLEDIARAGAGARVGLEQLSKTYAGDMELVSEIAGIISTINTAEAIIADACAKKIYLGRVAPEVAFE